MGLGKAVERLREKAEGKNRPVQITDGYLEFTGRHYYVNPDWIPDYEVLLRWILHLLGKSWVTKAMLRDFIVLLCSLKGWKVG